MTLATMTSALGSYNGKQSTNAAQEFHKSFASKGEALAYSKYFLRNHLGKTHPDIIGEITGVCGIKRTPDGYKLLVSTYAAPIK